MWGFKRRAPPAQAPLAASSNQADPEALLNHIDWSVLRRLDGLLQGQNRSLFRGSGLDLAELREYQTHDDVRHIDWMVTARTGSVHVREHLEDREIQAWFLVDMSGSMDFGRPGQTKRDGLLRWVAILSRLMMTHGNRVGAIVFGVQSTQEMIWIPARMGRRHVLHVMQRLQQARAAPRPHVSPLDLWLRRAASLLPRRSQVWVISDFLSPAPWEKSLAQLAQRHDGMLLRLTDPLEQALPDAGMFWVQDAETAEQIWVDSSDPDLRKRYAQSALTHRQRLVDAAQLAGMDALEWSTHEDVHQALLRFVRLREHKARHA